MTERIDGMPPPNRHTPEPLAVPAPQRLHPVWWLIAVSLAVIAVCLVLRISSPRNPAFAQSVSSAGAHGVFAFTGQLAEDAYGVFMVDVDTGTLWCYRYFPGKNELKFVAARNWLYDRYLENYSTEPPPKVIEEMLEDQRAAKLRQATP